MRRGLVLLLLTLAGGIARADDAPRPPAAPVAPAPVAKPAAPPTPEQAADAVLTAVKAKDEAALEALAAEDAPDPWLVADELIRRGEFGAADAFAKAAPRVDVEKLPAYVASRRGKPDDAARRARLAATNVALQAGKFADALEALGAAESGPIEDVVGVRLAMGRGSALASLARFEAAAAAFEAAGEAAERLGWLARAVGALGESGAVAFRGAAFPAVLGAWERRRAICERRGDRAGMAAVLGNIGVAYAALGDHAKALSTYERALAAQEALGNKAGAALTLGNIGLVYYQLGDYAKALEIQERARSETEALGDKAGAARALGNIANVYASLGDYAKALLTYERALAAKEVLGDKAEAAVTLGNIGLVYQALGDYANALATHQRALAAKEALGDKAGAAKTLCNIGLAYGSLRDYPNSLSSHERALAVQEALGDKAGAAQTLSNIGLVYQELGDPAKALSTLERALAAQESLGDKTGAARTLGHIAFVCDLLGDHAKAMAFARRAASSLASVVSGLGAEEGAGAREPLSSVYDVGAQAAVAAHDAPALAYFLESGRAGALLEGLEARKTLWLTTIPPALRAEEAQARAAETAATQALRRASDAGDLAAARRCRADLDAARERTSAVVGRIQREAKAGAALVCPEAATLDQIRATLAEGDVLVLYGILKTEACALVVTLAEARIVALGARTAVEEAVDALALDDWKADPTSALATIEGLVIAPLHLPSGTRRLLVSPTGVLGLVPFAALVPGVTVAYVPSGTTYRLLREDRSPRGDGVLALGDPDYAPKADERSVAGAHGGSRLAPLPGTREEAKAIGTQVLLGQEATEAGFREAVAGRPRWRAVHFACHGLVDTERWARSSLALTPAGDDDGFLTALDVFFRTKIPADLAVLSACETGKGKIVNGEGIVGLTRAFMYAGAPRVICSLWKVDDQATRALMTKFYELWNPSGVNRGKPGLPTAEALRKAQEFVKSEEKWKHPYYWAAWVLWGLPE